ncbi:MAG: PfkB family carbohydrate kinase [Candidatus Zixiibacteriota bacterium]
MADIIKRIEGRRVAVFGDPCLDLNVYGRGRTVAKEAPVIAFEVSREVYAPGQATNVAANAAALGARVSFVGLAGPDAARDRLADLLESAGVDVSGLLAEPGRPTTFKTKYVTREKQRHGQHVFHVYREEGRGPSRQLGRELRAAASRALTGAGVAVLSDYAGGTLVGSFPRWLIGECGRKGVKTVANGRGDLRKFRGATLIVGNEEELALAAGGKAGAAGVSGEALARAAGRLDAQYLVITAGADGMYVRPPRGRVLHFQTAARELTDVTGAGDTVTAALAAALGAGVALGRAAAFANLAAAAAVGREGTTAVRAEDLAGFLGGR